MDWGNELAPAVTIHVYVVVHLGARKKKTERDMIFIDLNSAA